jgi:hypothetical protein
MPEGDVALRLLEKDTEQRRKVESLREQLQSRELQECTQASMAENSKMLASKWVEQGDVVTRLLQVRKG